MSNLSDEEFMNSFESELVDTLDKEVNEDDINDELDEDPVDEEEDLSTEDGNDESDESDESDDLEEDTPFTGSEDGEVNISEDDGVSDDVDPELYVDFYKKVMAPFKANGKQVELRNPEEAIQLMQMGANYTKKMQAIAKHQKAIMMLERNELLDEDKLSFLIDLQNKDPEAIKKFFADSELDPLDIDVDSEVNYRGGRHKINDSEVRFKAVIDEVMAEDQGVETIQRINREWDNESVEELQQRPDTLKIIHAHMKSGIYDAVIEEIDRQKLLGTISVSSPFMEAYRKAGDDLINNGVIVPNGQTQATKPIARGTGKGKTAVNNKAKAASITRNSGKKVATTKDLLNLSDEEFLKEMEGRL